METQVLKARPREERGSAAARRLRRAGVLPAVVAGLGEEPVAIAVAEHDFGLLQQRGVQLVELRVGRKRMNVVIREVQHDPVTERVLHVDFDRVKKGEVIEVRVPLTFFGEPAEAGDFLQVHQDSVAVHCLPSTIPESFEVDLRDLCAGAEIRARDLTLPEGVELAGDAHDDLLAVISGRVEEEEEKEEEGLAEELSEEPEVMGKGGERQAEEEAKD